MRQVTLLFPDTGSLWAFAQTLRADHIHINSMEKKITCNCTDADISKAMIEFSAEIVEEIEQRG